ncbi:MAG: cell wall hydrolase [Hyphomicrobiales bacterium]|nr:cell wall hydrolase [Hyphomicrobiales bacterium]MDE2114942.1 cell wall hydrolase [Hyphomicrobiales bacterium]
MSFAADAGQDVTLSTSVAFITSPAIQEPVDLVGGRQIARLENIGTAPDLRQPAIQLASLDMHFDPVIAARVEDFQNAPNPALKINAVAHQFPTVDRSGQGDAFVPLRPALSRLFNFSNGLESARRQALIFDADASRPAALLSGSGAYDVQADGATQFVPWAKGQSPILAHDPDAVGQGATPHSVKVYGPQMHLVMLDGATPKIARSIALSSTTPVAQDAVPVTISAATLDPAYQRRVALLANHQPDFEQLISPDQAVAEQHCLAQAIYFEARSESPQGQAAVAQVIFNRVKSGLYPKTVCGVVFQNRRMHNACQFSFACNGQSLAIVEPKFWQEAKEIAKKVTEGQTYIAKLGDATHYHANYVRPSWARHMKKVDVIGHHIFYKTRANQS